MTEDEFDYLGCRISKIFAEEKATTKDVVDVVTLFLITAIQQCANAADELEKVVSVLSDCLKNKKN